MIRFLARMVLTVVVGFSGYCVSNPAFPHRLLNRYVQANSPREAEFGALPRKDIQWAQSAIKFLENQHGVRKYPAAQTMAAQSHPSFDNAFFYEEETFSNSSTSSDLMNPYRQTEVDMRYAPIETGSAIQSNPYLQ